MAPRGDDADAADDDAGEERRIEIDLFTPNVIELLRAWRAIPGMMDCVRQ